MALLIGSRDMNGTLWIWQQPDWPAFRWQEGSLAPLLRACQLAQGRLIGAAGAVEADAGARNELDTLLKNIVTSSAIEGEDLNVASVRSSLARRLGLEDEAPDQPTPRSEGLAELLLDATRHVREVLDLNRLLHWHRLLFPADSGIFRPGLEHQVDTFLDWFATSLNDPSLDPLIRAGVAHFWFVTLHPFDDGNGRLTRAITDLALAQAEQQAIRFYTMSASILNDRRGYYEILEASQRDGLDITPWLEWFLRTLLRSVEQALEHIDRVLDKARFWRQHRAHELSSEQMKVLNRLLDGGDHDFPLGISASQYQAVARVSKATATRHLADLLDKGLIERLPGGGRSTRYRISLPEQRDA